MNYLKNIRIYIFFFKKAPLIIFSTFDVSPNCRGSHYAYVYNGSVIFVKASFHSEILSRQGEILPLKYNIF